MGVVYAAHDRERNVQVALKVLHRLSPDRIARFKGEFRAVQNLSHPNLVAMGELLEADGHWFFTMELVDGVDFARYVRPPAAAEGGDEATLTEDVPAARATARFDEARLRAAAGQLARAISAVHAAGMIHRDVKSSNVRVTPQGRVVLLDFGLVRDARELETTETDTVGTVAYMAPEQAFGGAVGPPVDWYAFGVMLYEALTGRMPHDGGTPLELLARRRDHPARPPREWWPEVPADLDRLCVDLLAIDPAARPDGASVLERLGVNEGPRRRAVPTTPPVPVLGRDRELAAVVAPFDDVRRGRPQAVWISGRSGVGKSTLLARACEELVVRDPDTIVLSGRCFEREWVPYKALDGIADALAGVLRRMPASQASPLLPEHAAILPSLFPALGRVDVIARAVRSGPVLLDPHDLRTRAFAALRELIARLTRLRPVVVTIDDIQWSDADSRLLLSEILRPPDPPALLLLLASRTGDDGAGEGARPALLSAIDGMPVTALPLGPLALEPATALARLLLGTRGDVDPALLAREADGHPLFLGELARHALAEDGRDAPLRLDDAIAARAEALPDDARRLVEVVCLAGAPLAQDVLRDAAELAPGELDRVVARLRIEHLVRTSGARGRDPIEPYHDRVREAVAAAVPAEVRRQRHRGLALAIERSLAAGEAEPGGEHAALLVRHWEEAGEPDRAAAHARAGAARARELLAFGRAAALLGDALRLGHFDGAARRALTIERAHALANAGSSAEAAAAFVAAADDAGPDERLELERLAAENFLISGQLEVGLGLLRDLLAHVGTALPSTPGRGLRSLIWHRLRIALRGLRFRPRPEHEIPRALLAREDLYKTVSHGLGMIDSIRGADFQARNLLASLRTGDPVRVAQAIGAEVIFRAAQGGRGLRSATELARRLGPLADDTGNPIVAPWRDGSAGVLLYFGGRFGEARAPLALGEREFHEGTVGTIWERNTLRLFRLFNDRQAGAARALRELYEDTVRDAERRGDRYVDSSARRAGNRVFLFAGEPERARAELERATWVPPDGRFHLQHWFELEAGGDLALYVGRPTPARAALDHHARAFARSLLPRVQMVRVHHTDVVARLLVAEALEAADPEPLRARARKLARTLARERAPYATVFAHVIRAALATQEGRADDAVAELRAALAVCAVTSQAAHAAACRLRLAHLIGGADGDQLRAEALVWFRAERIPDPDRVADLLTPGFR